MLPAIQHRVKSRLSLYNVIPPIGAPIHSFQNRDEEIWSTLQRIREMEKSVSQQNSQAARELNFPQTVQETSLSKTEEGNNHADKGERMNDGECREHLFEVPLSPSDSEVECSIVDGNVHQLVLRYSPTDQESSSDSESLSRVLGNSMSISWPENTFKDEGEELEGMPAVRDSMTPMEK